jgi:GntR family transcriptional regulator, transcriptional repressor for pyruvate dehydrogenase complex
MLGCEARGRAGAPWPDLAVDDDGRYRPVVDVSGIAARPPHPPTPADLMDDAQPSTPGPARGLLGDGDLTLARETLADRMTTQLRQQILSGRLSPGDLVPTERELREAFGVSRATVREALHGLVSSGFLERRSNQLFVRDRREIPDHEVDYAELAARLSVEDVFETRKALESAAVDAAARHCSTADVSELRAILERMRPGTGPDYHSADIEFHTAIVRMARNAVLLQVYESSKYLFFRLPSFWRVFAGHDPATAKAITGYDGHAPLVDAIERHDPAAAVRINDDLLDRVSRTLVQRLSNRRPQASQPGDERRHHRMSQ